MNMQKFYGSNSREAMDMVREALGGDALILSNRKVKDGVEIVAVAGSEVDNVTYQKPTPPTEKPKPAAKPMFGAIAAILNHREELDESELTVNKFSSKIAANQSASSAKAAAEKSRVPRSHALPVVRKHRRLASQENPGGKYSLMRCRKKSLSLN